MCYLSILKEGFLAYLSLFMLISRKVTEDKSCNTLETFKCESSKE